MVCIYSETSLFCCSSGKVLLNMPEYRLLIARAAGKHSLKENQTHGLKAKTGHYSHLFQPDAQVGHRISSTELCYRENKCWVWMAYILWNAICTSSHHFPFSHLPAPLLAEVLGIFSKDPCIPFPVSLGTGT